MPISVVCPHCTAKLNAPDTAAGKRVKCPKCQKPIPVPEEYVVEEEQDYVVEEEAPLPVAKAAKSARMPIPKSKRSLVEDEDDEDDDDRPRKKKKKGVSPIQLISTGVALLVGLGAVIYFATREKSESTDSPTDLAANTSRPGKTTPPTTDPGPKPPATGPGQPPPPTTPKKDPEPKKPPLTDPSTLTPTAAFTRKWQKPSTIGDILQVTFPSGPYSKDKLPGLKLDGDLALSPGGLETESEKFEMYMAGFVNYPKNLNPKQKATHLEEFISSVGMNAEGKAKKTVKPVTHKGKVWQEHDLVWDSQPVKSHSVARTFDQGDKFLFVLCSRYGGPPPADVQKIFFDSLTLLK